MILSSRILITKGSASIMDARHCIHGTSDPILRWLHFQGGNGLISCAVRLLIATSSFLRPPTTGTLSIFPGANANGGGGLDWPFRILRRFDNSAFNLDFASGKMSSFQSFFWRSASVRNHCPATPTLYLQQLEKMSKAWKAGEKIMKDYVGLARSTLSGVVNSFNDLKDSHLL